MVKLAKSLLTKQIKLTEDESNYKEEAEIAARESYSKKSGNLVQTTGFWCQKEFAWLGARPDGIVIDIKLEQRGLLAIECPYSARSMTIQQYSKQSDSCLVDDYHTLTLDKKHACYFSIQASLFALDAEWCDFVVWTHQDMHIVRVVRHQNFIDEIVLKATEFYVRFLLPALATKSYIQSPQVFNIISKPAYDFEFKAVCTSTDLI